MVLIDTDGTTGDRRVIKHSLHRLTRGNQALATTIERLVIMNSRIAVRGSMVMNHLVIYCTANDIPLPVLDQNLIYDAFNFCPRKGFDSIKNEHLRHVVKETKHVFPNPSDGDVALRGVLIGHLVNQYTANIKSSIVGKWYSVIKNSINTHLKIYYPEVDGKERKNMFNKINKRITRPQPDQDDEEYLDEAALELVQFHRSGFGVDDDGWVNNIFIDNKMQTAEGISNLIQHFSQCLLLQCNAETEYFDGENCLRKQTALPEFCIGRKSINIDQKGLYYLVKQYMSDIGKGELFVVAGGANGFRVQLFVNWLKNCFTLVSTWISRVLRTPIRNSSGKVW